MGMPSIMEYTNIHPKLARNEDTFWIIREEVLTVIVRESILLGMKIERVLLPNVLFWEKCWRLKHQRQQHSNSNTNNTLIAPAHPEATDEEILHLSWQLTILHD